MSGLPGGTIVPGEPVAVTTGRAVAGSPTVVMQSGFGNAGDI
jgi:hypothetical protein